MPGWLQYAALLLSSSSCTVAWTAGAVHGCRMLHCCLAVASRQLRCPVCWPSAILQLHKKPDGPMIMMPSIPKLSFNEAILLSQNRRFNENILLNFLLLKFSIARCTKMPCSISNRGRGGGVPSPPRLPGRG